MGKLRNGLALVFPNESFLAAICKEAGTSPVAATRKTSIWMANNLAFAIKQGAGNIAAARRHVIHLAAFEAVFHYTGWWISFWLLLKFANHVLYGSRSIIWYIHLFTGAKGE